MIHSQPESSSRQAQELVQFDLSMRRIVVLTVLLGRFCVSFISIAFDGCTFLGDCSTYLWNFAPT